MRALGIILVLLIFLCSGCTYVGDGKGTVDLNQFIKEDDSSTEYDAQKERFEKLREEYERTGEVPEELTESEPPTTTPAPTYGPEQLAECEESSDKDECYYNYATQNEDFSYCKQISQINKREECLVAQAKK